MTVTITTEAIIETTQKLREHTAQCAVCTGFIHYCGNDGLQAQDLVLCDAGQDIILTGLFGGRPVPEQTISRGRRPLADWSKVDWTKKSGLLAKEIGCSRANVVLWRKRVGFKATSIAKPPIVHSRDSSRKITEEMIAAADWLRKTDMDLQREWGVTRERVRQIREGRGLPICIFKHSKKGESRNVRMWVLAHRQEIEGKHFLDIIKLLPPTTLPKERLAQLFMDMNVPFVRTPRPRWAVATTKPVNWDLPNMWLALVWAQPEYHFATSRYRFNKRRAEWCSQGGSKFYLSNPEFLTALQQEIDKAKSHGVIPDEAKIASEIERKKNAYNKVGIDSAPVRG